MGQKRSKLFFSGSVFGHAVQQVNLSIFHQASINTAHQTRLTFDLGIEKAHGHSSSFRTRPHECVGDSAEKSISIHALGRERLLVLSCGLLSHPLKILFRPLGDNREFLSQLSIDQPPNVFSTHA